jgi:thiol-disulfide isomerase/thioredoxin
MRNNTLFLILSAIVIYSCSNKQNSFKLSGKFTNGEGKTIHLQELKTEEIGAADSVKISSDGTFEFHGKIESPKFFSLYISPNKYVTFLINPGEKISVTADSKNILESYDVEGSDDSRLVRELDQQLNYSLKRIDSLSKAYELNRNNPLKEQITDSLNHVFEKIDAEEKKYTLSFIKKNTQSLATYMALYQKYDYKTDVLDKEKDFDYFKMVDSSLSKRYPESMYVKKLNKYMNEVGDILKSKQMQQLRYGTGATAPDISLPNPEGIEISLSSLKGNYVLLDFWASWCPPCRSENPNLLKIYKKYHSAGFEIFQVSLDKTKAAWVYAIREDHLSWINVSDLKFWNSVVVPLYNIESIPANFLLDRNGRIIAKNLMGDDLSKKLEEIYRK